MEALAVLGGVAAAWTLSADLIKLGRYLRKMVKSIKYARRDISKTAHEMIVFAELFQDFLDVCYDSLASVSKKSPPPLSLISWTESAILGLRELLRKVGAPTSVHKDGYSLVETLTTHVKWYLSRESVKYFRALLAVARESIQAFSNIRCIEKLEEQLGVLKQAIENGTQQSLERKLGMTLLERRNIVQHQM